jgi:hypothetical protein
VLPAGRLLSLIPNRCICRQSNLGGVNLVGAILTSPAFSPSRIRTAAAAAMTLPSCADCMDPPRIDLSEPDVKVRKNRCVGCGRKFVQRSVTLVSDACGIDAQQVPENGTIRWKICSILEHVLERQLVIPFKFDPSAQWFPAKMSRWAKPHLQLRLSSCGAILAG